MYPVVEYGQIDPLLQPQSAVIGGARLPPRRDQAAGEPADLRGQPERRDLLRSAPTNCRGRAGCHPPDSLQRQSGEPKTLLQIIQDKNVKQGRTGSATRADLRFGDGPDGQMFLLNKRDGTIRLLVPDGSRPSGGAGR